MANYCSFNMYVVGKSEKSLKKMLDILKYKDTDFCLCGVLNGEEAEPIEDESEDGLLDTLLVGGVKWSADRWFGEPDNPNRMLVDSYEKNEDGTTNYDKPIYASYKMRSIMTICRALDIGVEIYTSEPGIGFQEHYIVNHNGEIMCNETTEWHEEYEDENGEHHPEEGGFDDFCSWSYPHEIY